MRRCWQSEPPCGADASAAGREGAWVKETSKSFGFAQNDSARGFDGKTGMRAVVQRVSRACVRVESKTVGEIGKGLLVLVGVAAGDTPEAADAVAEKVASLRIFPDAEGKMNLSVADIGGAVLAVSQFTLLGDVRKGRRPSFIQAAPPDQADALYQHFLNNLRSRGLRVESGVFRAMMEVELVNDGPVTILIDSEKLF
jgi:D-tyrosyl-tRNA(Tyr) deacylase